MILSLFSLGFASRVRMGIDIAGRVKNNIKSVCLAQAAVLKIVSLLKNDPLQYDALTDIWNDNEEELKGIQLGEGYFSIAYSQYRDNAGIIIHGLIDEERKININTASKDVLQALPGIDESIAASIIDWRDADDGMLPHGAERSYYANLPEPYLCKNALFETLDELLLVKGITPDVLDAVESNLTVHGDGKININTCSREILEALGIDPVLSQKIVEVRKGTDQVEGTEDDVIFMNVGQVKSALENLSALNAEENAQVNKLINSNLIKVNSTYFRADIAVGFNDAKDDVRNYAVVCNRKDGRIVQWDEE